MLYRPQRLEDTVPNAGTLQLDKDVGARLAEVSESMRLKTKELSKGYTERIIDGWFRDLHNERPELFKEANFENFSRLVAGLEVYFAPRTAAERCLDRGIFFDIAYRESTENCFMIRQRLLDEFRRPEVSQEVARRMQALHFVLAHAELSEIISKTSDMGKTEFNTARAALVSALSDFGAENPEEIEVLFSLASDIFLRQRKYLDDIERKINSGELGVPADNAGKFLGRHGSQVERLRHSLTASRYGIRGEIIANLILKEVLPPGVEVMRPTSDVDTFGVADFYLCAVEGDNVKVLVGVDVKTENRGLGKRLDDPESCCFGVLTKIRSVRNGEFVVDSSDGDNVAKPIPASADDFILRFGLPILGLRVPNFLVKDDFGRKFHEGCLIKDILGIAAGEAGDDMQKEGMRLSRDMIKYAISMCIKKRMEVLLNE